MLVKIFEFNGYTYRIKIGRNEQENWDLISSSNENDLWFHLGGNMSSPHVVLEIIPQIEICDDILAKKYKKNKIHPAIIFKCSILCKEYSKFKCEKNIPVIYTEIKNITKADKVGSVYAKKTKHINV